MERTRKSTYVLFFFPFLFFQYYSDANDAESWMTEKMYVASSEDYGRDEQSAMVCKNNCVKNV